MWKVIENGPHIPTKKVDNKEVPNLEAKWNEEDNKKFEINYKAINYLYCAINSKELKKLICCTTAKEM